MRLEIVSAADFLVQLLRLQRGRMRLSESQLQMFKHSLQDVLRRRYTDHWFPDSPNRGSGYRCLRINGKMDPIIAQAGINVGLGPTLLHTLFPSELTMWIDPAEVSYRIGENGSICVLYEGLSEGSSPSTGSFDEPIPKVVQKPTARSLSSSLSSSSLSSSSYYMYGPSTSHNHQQRVDIGCVESCKDTLLFGHTQFSEQYATFVSS